MSVELDVARELTLYKGIGCGKSTAQIESLNIPPLLKRVRRKRETMTTYKKEEYNVNGQEIIIQQVRGPESSHGASEPSAWINGGAAYALEAVEALPVDVSHREPFDQVKAVVAFAVDNDVRFCPKCDTFQDASGFVGTGFAGRKCGECNRADNTCTTGGKHSWNCTNPRQKNNARVPTKYTCTECGKKRQTTPTG